MKNMLHLFSRRLILENSLILVVLGMLVGLVYIQVNPLEILPGRDNGFFLYGGRQILNGKLPYVDFWDHKGPLIYYLNALGLWLGRETRWGVWFLEVVFMISAAFLGYRGFACKWGHAAALFASVVWLYGLTLTLQDGNNTEGYTLLFAFLLIYLFLTSSSMLDRKLLIGIGFSLACSFMLRANNIGTPITALAAVLLPFIWNRQFRQVGQVALWAGGAFLLTILPVLAYFGSVGLLEKMFEASILYNFYYSGVRSAFNLNILPGILFLGWPAYLAVVAYVYLLWRLAHKNQAQSSSMVIFLLLGLPVESLLSSISGRNYYHYFVLWMPALASLVAFGFSAFATYGFSAPFRRFLEHPIRFHAVVLGMLVFLYAVGGAGETYRSTLFRLVYEREKGVEKVDPVARYVRQNTRDEDFVLVWGAYAPINFLARRDSPTPYIVYPAYSESPYTELMSQAFYEDVLLHPPTLIIDASVKSSDYILSINPQVRRAQFASGRRVYQPPYQQEFFDFVADHYQLDETIQGFEIYRLKTDK